MEFEKVEDIPEREFAFKIKEETEKLIGILNGLSIGETLHFPISENDGRVEAKAKSDRLTARFTTAMKRAEGHFKIARRRFDIYVKRLE